MDEGSKTTSDAQTPTTARKRKYDLPERTARFGESVIEFSRKVPKNVVSLPLISQLVRAGTSVGANNCEAEEAVSRREFRNKLGHCKKEAREAKFWIRMIVKAEPSMRADAEPLWREAHELHLIFAQSFRTAGRPRPADKE